MSISNIGLVTNIKNCSSIKINAHRGGPFLMLLGLLCGVSCLEPAHALESFSIYGSEIPEIYGRHFFSYFHFRPVGYSVTKDGFTEVSFRLPHSNRFHPFVSLFVDLSETGKIIRARLVMQRRFVDDKVRGAFARDVAKSFVQAAVPDEDLDKARPIYNEIFFRQEIKQITLPKNVKLVRSDSKELSETTTLFKLGSGKLKTGDIIIFGKGNELPKLPKKPSTLYRCFAGEIKTSHLQLTDTILKFSNEMINNEFNLLGSNSPPLAALLVECIGERIHPQESQRNGIAVSPCVSGKI